MNVPITEHLWVGKLCAYENQIFKVSDVDSYSGLVYLDKTMGEYRFKNFKLSIECFIRDFKFVELKDIV